MERTFQTHLKADLADYRPGDVSDDLAEHLRRHLLRERPVCPREQQVNKLALRPAASSFVYHGNKR